MNRVVASNHPRYREGDLVLGNAGWQDYALSDGADLMPIDGIEPPRTKLNWPR